MASPILDRKLPVGSYTDFQHPQSIKQSTSMGSCSPVAFSPLPSGFGKGQRHHQPDTSSFTPAVCALPQQQRHQEIQCSREGQLLSPPACCIESSSYMSPYSPYQPRSHSIWPSPPLRPGDIHYCMPFQDLPACGSASLPCHSNSPASPGGWSSVSGYPPTSGFFHSQHPGDQPLDRVCTPMSAQELSLQHSDIHTPYTASFQPDSDVEIPASFNLAVSSHAMPELSAVPPSSSAGSPDGLQAETPASFISPKIEHIDGQDAEFMESILAAPRANEPVTMSSARHDDKADEPYAKLIYKALMGQPDYTMTLQELYQWFRDHTSKAKNERGGWQNSIRHNLSMNAAFKRRDRKRVEETAPSACAEGESLLAGEVKRANEWILEDWAVRDGVQSTTRYRKGNSGRRSSRRSSSHLDMGMERRINQRNSNVRALSGQKGGCAARNSRIRSHLYGQELPLASGRQYRLVDSGLGSPPATSLADPFYSMPIAIPRIDPTAIQTLMVHGHSNSAEFGAVATAATELYGLQMAGPRMDQQVAGGGGNGHSGIHAVSYMSQQEQMYLEPSPAEFPYGIADVQLDYSGDHTNIDVPEQIRRHNTIIGTPRIGWTSPNDV